MISNIPIINNRFICIVDHYKSELAAVISSYLHKKDHYLPIFQFPTATSENYEPEEDTEDENTLSRIRAQQFSVFVNNALVRMGLCEYVILAGLSANQKSYLDFTDKLNVIEITEIAEVDFYLSPFLQESKGLILCKRSELLVGLFLALNKNSLLQINEDAENLQVQLQAEVGIIVIEDVHRVASVIAVNYACSINASISIVDKLEEDDKFMVQSYIQEWQTGDLAKYQKIEKMVKDRVGEISFDRFTFGTFFTVGLPYSLILKNSIPYSYVNIDIRPDFFIINNLLYERNPHGGAVVFSPEFFKDEETRLVSSILTNTNYLVKELFGKDASVYNLGMHLKEFPYDIFHLCSHGGEIEGHTIEETFIDRDGNNHTIEYDQLLSFSPSSRKGLIHVQNKVYFRKFDGFIWRSPELKSKNYPRYVFVDMNNAMRTSQAAKKKVMSPKKKISNSCTIQCSDTSHQGMLDSLASHTSPIVFNNTCWSWYHIAEPFLVSGVRGYIGTLWGVENKIAIDFATEFYKSITSNTLLNSFHKAMKMTNGSISENIYIFWGLHFSTFTVSSNKAESRANIFKQLMRSVFIYENKLQDTKSKTISDSIIDLIRWLKLELKTTFDNNDFELLMKEFQKYNKT